MPGERVLIRDVEHSSHFASDLSASLSSSKYSDVVLRCAITNSNKNQDAKKKDKTKNFSTFRVHRLVLAAISDHLAQLIKDYPNDEDIHITLDQTSYEVAKLIVEFAYAGEVRIPKHLATQVCDAAHRMQIKFLKDSFIKVTDQDYAAMKAGKKTFESLQKEKASSMTKSFPVAISKKRIIKVTSTKQGKQTTKPVASSDTDSAESDGESKDVKPTAVQRKNTSKAKGKKKADSVMFTLTKQVEDKSNKKVSDNGTVLVHFNQKKENKKILVPVAPKATAIPSSVASIQQPLPPSALPKVKKVMIPPMMRKPMALTLPKNVTPGSPPTFTLARPANAQAAGSPQIVNLNAFQVQTIRQADGSQIQVLKPPAGAFMKQIKRTNVIGGDSKIIATTPSNNPPKDALALAMENVGGAKPNVASSIAIQLPKSPIPMTKVSLPTSPLPVSGISLPAKPLPASAISGLKKTDLLNKKPIISSTIIKAASSSDGNKPKTNITILHPPGYAPLSTLGGLKATSQSVALSSPAQQILSQPKLSIPTTLPDDFLDDSTPSSNASNNNANATSEKNKRSKTTNKALNKKNVSTNKKEAEKKVETKEVTSKSSSEEQEMEIDNSTTRSSGRVRKANPKYQESDKKKEEEKTAVQSSKKNNNNESLNTDTPNRKRKAAQKPEKAPPAKKEKPAPEPKTPTPSTRSTRNAAKSATNTLKKETPVSSKVTKRERVTRTANIESKTRSAAKQSDESGKRLRKRKVVKDM